MAVAISPKRIVGRWNLGSALDIHTVGSVHVGINEFGHDVFDTKRSELGQLLYRLKYCSDLSAVDAIVEATAEFLNPWRNKFDLIVPVPPSGSRSVQPVIILARGIGNAVSLPVAECVTTTRSPIQLKGVRDRQKRRELLDGLYAVDRTITEGKNILLFDDLYRSGSTMNAIADLVRNEGHSAVVRVLTVTKTRSIQ